jgi:hypothetical protein
MIAQPVQAALFEGIEQRERILRHYEQNSTQYLSHVRALALELARSRFRAATWPERLITIDDVRDRMRELKVPFPHDFGADDRILGAVLRRCHGIRAVGLRTSTRPERLARSGPAASGVTEYVYHPESDLTIAAS